jgi:pimeloyl-ACP methyl ester carboxylesterase
LLRRIEPVKAYFAVMTAGDLVTRYARSGLAHIAYQVIGEGPPLVLVPGLTSHLELQWEDAAYRSFVRRLARFATVIRYDKRGTGLSDPVSEVPSLDERAGDLGAVIAAAGIEKPVLFGYSEGGHIAVRFAATCGQALTGVTHQPPSTADLPAPFRRQRTVAAKTRPSRKPPRGQLRAEAKTHALSGGSRPPLRPCRAGSRTGFSTSRTRLSGLSGGFLSDARRRAVRGLWWAGPPAGCGGPVLSGRS